MRSIVLLAATGLILSGALHVATFRLFPADGARACACPITCPNQRLGTSFSIPCPSWEVHGVEPKSAVALAASTDFQTRLQQLLQLALPDRGIVVLPMYDVLSTTHDTVLR
jgi:hypothetical protein